MSVNHQGKYFIIRMLSMAAANGKSYSKESRAEQKSFCYRKGKIEVKPTNQPQQWQQQNILHSMWISKEIHWQNMK